MAHARADDPLFIDVNIFDGINERPIKNANVSIERNLIKRVSQDAIEAKGATVIDGSGRTLMPGLIHSYCDLTVPECRMYRLGGKTLCIIQAPMKPRS